MLPGLSAIYDLKWDDLANMPYSEVLQYVDELDHWAHVLSSGAFESKRGKR